MIPFFPYITKIILSAQSFNDRILKLMWRKYTVDELISILVKIKKYNKDIILENQIIYCYPTETFEEFKNNFKYIQYYKENIFNQYSYHEWIKKYNDNDLITKEERIKRSKILLELEQKYSSISISWNWDIYPWKHKGDAVKCSFKK
jgi:tRNA A37 methylthiotransferase MiaB